MKLTRTLPMSRLIALGALGLLSLGCGSSKTVDPLPKEPPPPEVDPRYRVLPTPTPAPAWAPPSVQKKPQPSGLTLWHLDQGSVPLVSIQLVLPLGSAGEAEEKAGLTLLAADLLDEGAGSRSALELSEELDRIGTDYSAQTGVDYVLLSMNALAENLDASLELLSDIVLRPKLSADEFDRRKKHHQAIALAAKADPGSRKATALNRVLFGHGYGGPPTTGTEETLAALTLAEVKARVAQMTVPEGAHLMLAGDVDLASAEAALTKHFGSWTGKQTVEEPRIGEAAPAGRAYVVNFPGAAQSSMSVALPAGNAKDPHYFAELVMNQKLGESFTSRINMNLREDKGYTYGARSDFRRFRHAGYFSVNTNVLTETTAASIREIFTELSDYCDRRPLTRTEYQESVDGLLLGYPTRFARVSTLGLRLASLPIYDRPENYWTTWPSEVKKVDQESAIAAARPYCDPTKYSVVIAGDLLAIEPGLKKLGLDVVELDRNGFPASKGDSAAASKE